MVEKKEEKHMKRRAVAAMLAAGLILGSLAGCGGQEPESKSVEESQKEPESSAEDEQETEGESEAESGTEEESGAEPGGETAENDPFGKYEDGVTLTIARSSSNLTFDSSQDGYGSLEDNVWSRAYQEELGISLDYIWTAPDEEYETKWNVSITADDIPDVAVVPASIYKQLVEGGYVQDMTEYYEKYASDAYKAAVEADGGVCRSAVTQDGKLLGLPHPGMTPDDIEYLYIRRDWLEELNLPVPTTVDELLDTIRAFQEANMGGEKTVGMAVDGNLNYPALGDLRGIFAAYGVHTSNWLEDENGNLVYGDVQPEAKEALRTLQNMYKDGMIEKDFAAADWDTVSGWIASGQCGLLYGAYWIPGSLYNTETMEIDDWIVVEGVTVDGSPYVACSNATPWNYVFVKNGIEHPEAVVKMINLQMELLTENPQVYDGYAYEKDGESKTISALYYCLAPFLRAPWRNADISRTINEALETGDESKVLGSGIEKDYLNIKAVVKEGNRDVNLAGANLMSGPDGVFCLVDKLWEEGRIQVNKFTSVHSEFALQNMTNMNEILHSEYLKIIMGDDINNFDKAVDTWMKTGGERITQEVNEWYQSTK